MVFGKLIASFPFKVETMKFTKKLKIVPGMVKSKLVRVGLYSLKINDITGKFTRFINKFLFN